MGVAGELCMSRLCSSRGFFFHTLSSCPLIILFYVHSFDAWYVEIAHLSHPQAVFMNPTNI